MEKADKIYRNAKVWTGDANLPWAEALAVRGEGIAAVGKGLADWVGPETEVIDLEGKLVVPGFIDNHTHFLSGGFQLAGVDLRSAQSPAGFIERLADFARRVPAGRWITGGDWDHETWGGELPRKEWIDSVTTGNSVFVNRLDGHMALANSRVLRLAGIGRDTPDPPGGTIVRDPVSGEPTGILKDEAMSLVYALMPPPTGKELDEALQRAVEHALSLGLTQVHDMGSQGGWTDLATYRRAHSLGKLGIRVYSFVPLRTWQRLDSLVNAEGRGDDRLRWGGVKGFVDGSLGSTTAWFYEPYDDEPQTTGLLVNDTTAMKEWIIGANRAGLQLAVHAIGDRANDWLLSVYESAAAPGDNPDRRFRIEHAQHLRRQAIGRFATLGVIPPMQPYHAVDDGRWAEKRIGAERIKTTYAFRSLLEANAKLTFGSDWTVAPLNPLEGIHAAVTRQTIDGKNPQGWVSSEKIGLEEALRCFTAHNAFAGFQEDRLGILKKGFLADFAVLSENLFEIDTDRIKEVRVLRTVVGGEDAFVRD